MNGTAPFLLADEWKEERRAQCASEVCWLALAPPPGPCLFVCFLLSCGHFYHALIDGREPRQPFIVQFALPVRIYTREEGMID